MDSYFTGIWLLLAAVLIPLAGATGWLLYQRHKTARRRQRERRAFDELDDLGIDDVGVFLETGSESDQRLGGARLVRHRQDLARKGTGFYLAPADEIDWHGVETGDQLRLRFSDQGVRHELRCRFGGRTRLTSRTRRRFGVEGRYLYRLIPAGVIVRRERRDMMRFYVGTEGGTPQGTTDARRFVGLEARIRATDLDITGRRRLPQRLRSRELGAIGPDDGGAPDDGGCSVDIVDFSGTGLLVEASLATVGWLTGLGDQEPPEAALDRLAEQALLVTVVTRLDFPAKVEDLEPDVRPRTRLLAEAARVSLIEEDDTDDHVVRVGLAFLYEPLDRDPVTGWPLRWSLVKGFAEADHFVAIHSALNQAAGRIQSDDPGAGRPPSGSADL